MGQYVKAAHIEDVNPDGPTCVTVNEEEIALFKSGDEYYAIGNTCTHQGGPLCEGTIKGGEIECPWHGAHFQITTGKVIAPPAAMDVPKYNVRISGKQIEIEM